MIISVTIYSQTNNFPTNGDVTIDDGRLIQTGTNHWFQTQGSVKLKSYLLFDRDGDFTGGNYYTIEDDANNNLRLGYGFNNHLVINSSGNVGIGTSNPSFQLHLKDPSGGAALGLERGGKWWRFDVAYNAASKLFIGHTDQSSMVTLTDQGLMGIGTTSPSSVLHVNSASSLPSSSAGMASSGLMVSGIDGNLDLLSYDDNSTVSNNISFGRYNQSTGALIHKFGITSYANTGNTGSNSGDRISFSYGTNSNIWSNTSLMVIEAGGNVGIGTSSPSTTLHINDTSPNSALLRLDNNGTRETLISNYSDGTYDNAGLQFKKFSAVGQFKFSNNNGDLMTILSSGNVGIGTTNPQIKLHVKTANANSEVLRLDGGTRTTSIIDYSDGTYDNAGLQFKKNSAVGQFKFSNNNGDLMTILSSGNVGIGTTTTGSHKLAVEGSIGAREVKVEASGWSDFVFETDYRLKSLEEVEDHIAEHGHLPDVPSEKEVTENGINLGEMDATLLQKIEELTLYVIEQNKELKELKKKNEELEKRLEKVEK